MSPSTYTLQLISAVVAVPVLTAVFLATGRWLRRKFEIPLGVRFKVASLCFAAYLPLRIYMVVAEAQVALATKAGVAEVKVEGAAPAQLPVLVPEALLRLLLAMGIIFGALLSVSLVRKYFWDGWFERTQETRVPRFVSDIGSVLILGVALLIVAQGVYHLDLGGLQLGSTVSVAVLGFASQDLLGNLLSGVALQIGSPFKRGDWLVVDGRRLQVLEVNWRATRMRSPDNVLVEVPNKTIAGGVITNLSAPTKERAATVVVAFEQTASPDEVKACLTDAATMAAGVLSHPAPKAFLKEFGESAIQYEVSFWVGSEEGLADVADAVKTKIWYEMQKRGFQMPHTVRSVSTDAGERKKPSLGMSKD